MSAVVRLHSHGVVFLKCLWLSWNGMVFTNSWQNHIILPQSSFDLLFLTNGTWCGQFQCINTLHAKCINLLFIAVGFLRSGTKLFFRRHHRDTGLSQSHDDLTNSAASSRKKSGSFPRRLFKRFSLKTKSKPSVNGSAQAGEKWWIRRGCFSGDHLSTSVLLMHACKAASLQLWVSSTALTAPGLEHYKRKAFPDCDCWSPLQCVGAIWVLLCIRNTNVIERWTLIASFNAGVMICFLWS